ncbi:hypothetical protein CKK33_17800 [Mucilaginibacter sp. MD40]|uniref:glycosyl-4,4'-diaponeurosporenoate acyltransferase CrtO family protein n=1 Tax=Mucilaginibacter sp. MD40 TaxID=2029590 RepID=UPI000BAC6321|nr:hypothetical protein [Mucilaginibacter sp. MD40]PAW95253.1 hypothetical protein CKK33_17800 [Mucilaginibacter sp. MD40]
MNQLINFFWTIICFAPVLTYWFKAFDVRWLITAIAVSVAALIIPAKKLQLSYRSKFYEALGVRFIRRFVQNGDLANRRSRAKDPKYKHIRNRGQAQAYKHTIAMYERFHLLCLVFFFLTAILAVFNGYYLLAALVIIGNVIYNILPILLQQYNKTRLLNISK